MAGEAISIVLWQLWSCSVVHLDEVLMVSCFADGHTYFPFPFAVLVMLLFSLRCVFGGVCFLPRINLWKNKLADEKVGSLRSSTLS